MIHDADHREQVVIDEESLEQIRMVERKGKTGFLARVVGKFLKYGPPLVAKIEQGLRDGDHQAVLDASHSLKSCSALVGASSLSEHAAHLEAAVREQNADVLVIASGVELRLVLEDTCAALQSMIESKTPA